ncbi:glycosyltransferase [Clostridium tyrobutyricum]|uniref:glycosyltransferase n=1 Tax=Clostridium tyrobutyricum TaxID=1519 RepID=UPI001C3824BC|nr:glycosyltransferase [Clostridium tyrobutyricum]MBV4441699.1 glycosyltransferase [Clostridium tyrobutyricum]
MENDIDLIKKQLKDNIQQLVDAGDLKEAKKLIEQYKNITKDDEEAYSMDAVILIMEGKLEKAEQVLREGLSIDEDNFDLNYNLGYAYEKAEKFNLALECYEKARSSCNDKKLKEQINSTISGIKDKHPEAINQNRLKLVFFVKQGMDSFLGNIIDGLSDEYITKKVIVTDFKQIDKGMKWADICWFEWCDELVIYGSKLPMASEKKIICRLHRYEVFTNYPKQVNWNNVDKLIIVTKHLEKFLKSQIPNINQQVNIVTINNGVDLDKFKFKQRKIGFNIAYVGYIHARKNPVLLLQIINMLIKKDKRYKLYVAGEFQDSLIKLYWNDQLSKMNLNKNVIFQGWQDDIGKWLENKNYILSTSIHESFGYGIAEAMARGIKPVIHNFLFAEEIWNKKYLFNDISEAIDMITNTGYNSEEYRKFVENNYSLEKQNKQIRDIVNLYKNKQNYIKLKNDNFFIKIEKKLKQNTIFNNINDITLIIPTYNRSNILKSDLDKGFKLGEQNKIIVDDCSDKYNRRILINLEKNKKYGIKKIIFNEENKGVGSAVKTAVKLVDTKYTSFSGDDDIIFNFDKKLFKKNLNLLDNGYSLIVPRYVLNLNKEGKITLGYDRIKFNNVESKELLINMFLTGEMYVFNAGAIYKTKNLINSMAEEIFRVSEDYVMLSRVLSNKLYKRVKVSENYLYIRRVSNNTLSKKVSVEKISLNLLSLLVSGYYCLKNKFVTNDQIIKVIKKRGELLQKIWGYGFKFSEIIIMYINAELELKEFINIINKNNIIKNLTIDKVPIEIIRIKELMLKEGAI